MGKCEFFHRYIRNSVNFLNNKSRPSTDPPNLEALGQCWFQVGTWNGWKEKSDIDPMLANFTSKPVWLAVNLK